MRQVRTIGEYSWKRLTFLRRKLFEDGLTKESYFSRIFFSSPFSRSENINYTLLYSYILNRFDLHGYIRVSSSRSLVSINTGFVIMLRGFRTLFPESQKTPTFVPHWYIPSSFHGSVENPADKVNAEDLITRPFIARARSTTRHMSPEIEISFPPGNYLVFVPGNTAHDTSTITDTHCIFFLISSFETYRGSTDF